VEVLVKIETVVCVRAQRKEREVQFSGFLVHQEGLILCTARHIHDIEDVVTITVFCRDGRQIPGSLIKVDLSRDLTLIDVQGRFSNFVSVADSRNLLGTGETIYSVGCPINLGGTVYSGMVNGPLRLVDGMPPWQIHMEIRHGSSGSPVFDANGNPVAIIRGRLRGTVSIGFLIPIDSVVEFAAHFPEK
jgi:serine protease Do